MKFLNTLKDTHVWVFALAISLPAAAQDTRTFNDTQPLPNDESYIQRLESYDLNESVKNLRLNDVIEQGLRQNPDQEIRLYQDSILDIDWKDTHQGFWIPNLTLELNTAPQRIGTIREGNGGLTSKTPSGSLALRLSDYTVFNWGKDYLKYLNSLSSYNRGKERLKEERRELKHLLMVQFLDLLQAKEVERIAGNQLRHASFIYRLNRDKVAVNRVTRQEYYQARAEYLRAQTEYHQARVETHVSEERMAYLIQDPLGTRYLISDEIIPVPLKITLEEATRLARERNPEVLNQKTALENAKRDYDLTLRENLPLPRFSVDLGAYRAQFGRTTQSTRYGTGLSNDPTEFNSNSNIELVAAVNASWSITGPGGLLNSRKTNRSQLSQSLAFRQLSRSESQTASEVRELIKRIQHWQNQLKILEARTPTLQRNFDTILENYMNGKTPFVDFKNALEEMTEANQLLEFTKYSHARDKILLASEIGIEDFPGENFETQVQEKRRQAQ